MNIWPKIQSVCGWVEEIETNSYMTLTSVTPNKPEYLSKRCLWWVQWVCVIDRLKQVQVSLVAALLFRISYSSQCSTIGLTKAVVYAILSVHIKDSLSQSERAAYVVAAAVFLFRCLSGSLPYVRSQITVK